jgi:hypothetical protein
VLCSSFVCHIHSCTHCCCFPQVSTSKEKKGPRAKELKAKEVLQANFKVSRGCGGGCCRGGVAGWGPCLPALLYGGAGAAAGAGWWWGGVGGMLV